MSNNLNIISSSMWNGSTHLPNYVVSHPWWQLSSQTLLQEPHMSHLQRLLTVVLVCWHFTENQIFPIHQFTYKMQSLNIINLSPQFSSDSSKHRNYALISAAIPVPAPVPYLYLATSCYATLPASLTGTSAVRKFSRKLDAISKF